MERTTDAIPTKTVMQEAPYPLTEGDPLRRAMGQSAARPSADRLRLLLRPVNTIFTWPKDSLYCRHGDTMAQGESGAPQCGRCPSMALTPRRELMVRDSRDRTDSFGFVPVSLKRMV